MSLIKKTVKIAHIYPPLSTNDIEHLQASELPVYLSHEEVTENTDLSKYQSINGVIIDSYFSNEQMSALCYKLKELDIVTFVFAEQKNLEIVRCFYEGLNATILYKYFTPMYWPVIKASLEAKQKLGHLNSLKEKPLPDQAKDANPIVKHLLHTLKAIDGILWEIKGPTHTLEMNSVNTEFLGWKKNLTVDNSQQWTAIIHPEDAPRIYDGVLSGMSGKKQIETECRMMSAWGVYQWVRIIGSHFYDEETQTNSVIGVAFNNNELKTKSLQLNRSLEEKEELLREVFHRVNNNLQVIISILKFQVEQVQNQETKMALQESIKRIFGLSLAHEQLALSQSISQISLNQYLYSLISFTNYVELNLPTPEISVQGEEIKVHLDKIIPLGVILTEIINVSLQSTFKETKKNKINIGIKQEGKYIELTYLDHDPKKVVGTYSAQFTLQKIPIINLLLKQIDASLTELSPTYFNILLRFPLQQNYPKSNLSRGLEGGDAWL